MQGIFPSSGGLAMKPFRLAFVAMALGQGDLLLDTPVELPCEEFLPIAGSGGIP